MAVHVLITKKSVLLLPSCLFNAHENEACMWLADYVRRERVSLKRVDGAYSVTIFTFLADTVGHV